MVHELEPTEEEMTSRKQLLSTLMTSEYDRDWLFIVRRLINNYNGSEKQILLYLNDIAIFDESSKLSQIITMSIKPFLSSIKQVDNPSMQQVGKLFNSKPNEGRFLDLDSGTDDQAAVADANSISGSKIKTTNKTIKDMPLPTLDISDDNKNSRDLRERERQTWKLYESRVAESTSI